MRRNIIIFIAIVAIIELAVAYFAENDSEFSNLVEQESVGAQTQNKTDDEDKPFRVYIDISVPD